MSSPTFARPVAPWVGGKRNLARSIIPLIDAVPHELYAEPFVGMGGIFLRRSRPAKIEVINDWSADVATFFRVLQRHYVPFMDMLRFQLSSRAEFERLSAQDPATLTDLERAARFLFLQRTAFGGKIEGRTFAVHRTIPGRFDITKLGPMLDDLHTRLAGVVIERLHFAEFIRRYDRPGALFYLDPPYWGCEDYYGKQLFSRQDFAALATTLAGLKGHFIMSINDRPEILETFGAFHIRKVDTTYTLSAKGPGAFGELVISDLPPASE